MKDYNINTSTYFLTSERLGFRKWREEDFELAFALWGDVNVTKLIIAGNQLTEKDVLKLLTKEIESDKQFNVQYWPIFLLNTSEFIGCCGMRSYDLTKGIYEIGVLILPRHWRKGYAIEACRSVIDYAFKELNFSALFAGHNPNNVASKKLLEKLSFSYIRDEYYPPTGLNHPSYFLTKEEYVTWQQDH